VGAIPASEEAPRRHVPALDGVRALAVVAVFAYHSGFGWAQGGFLGVDVFFVLSGFLITSLLVSERRQAGRIDLHRFFRRRARRLLPALIALLVAVSVVVPLLARDQAYRLRGDVLSALGYVGNWRLVLERQSYFQAMGRPPLLQHLWSLAVEGQFYVVWPLVLVVLLRRGDARRLVWPILALAAASAGLMAVLYRPGVDPSRLYYGSDTRAAALLIGAALACRPPRWRNWQRPALSRRIALEVVSALALGALALAVVLLNQFDAALYRGGFLAVAALAAVLVALATHPAGWLGAALGSRPLVWLGRRSYSVYLWFWPVFMLTRPQRDVALSGMPLVGLRLAITLVLAEVSYRFVECPLRSGALGRAWAARRKRTGRLRLSGAATAWALVMAVAVLAIGSAIAVPRRPPPALSLSLPAVSNLAPLAESDAAIQAPVAGPSPEAAATPSAAQAPPVAHRTSAIGESVLLEAKLSLEREIGGIVVDAVVGRRFSDSLAAARRLRDQGSLGDEVIVQVGSNGLVTAAQFDELLAVLGDVRVLVVNVKVPRPWEGPNNEMLAAAVRKRPGAVLLDWRAIGEAHPDAFMDDGVHMTPAGLRLYMQMLLSKA